MRLFVAIDLNDPARAAIAAEQKRLAALDATGSSLRWVRAAQLHLTLMFLGEVDPSRALAATSAVSNPINRPPFDVDFAGLGVFPPRGAPRTLWVGVSAGQTELRELEHEIGARLRRAGFLLEDRPFSPHLTLARWKHSRPSDRTRTLSAARPGMLARVRVDHASLYVSRPSSDGHSYTELARANLTAQG